MELDVNHDLYPSSHTWKYENYTISERADNLTAGLPLPPHKFYLSILAMFKNEGPIMKEWLDHHIAHGIEHFYLINDHSFDNVTAILEPYVEKGLITMFPPPSVRTPFRQTAIYKSIIMKMLVRNISKWVAIMDLDEFLYSPEEVDIRVILRKHEKLSLVGLTWAWFGSNGHTGQPSNIVQSFTKRADFNYSLYPDLVKEYKALKTTPNHNSDWQKFILNMDSKIHTVDIHSAYVDGTIDNLSEQRYPGNPPLVLNHYSGMYYALYFFLFIMHRKTNPFILLCSTI